MVPEALGRICRIRGFRDDVYDDVRTHSWTIPLYPGTATGPLRALESVAAEEVGLHYGLKLRWIRFDSVPVLEWIVITGSLDWAKGSEDQ